MTPLMRLLDAERLKLRRSAALRTVWLLPLLFLLLEGLVFERPYFRIQAWPPNGLHSFEIMQINLVIGLWAGFFHPVLTALLPAFFFLTEHRFKLGRRLYLMPIRKRRIFLAKALWLLALSAASLVLIFIGLASIRGIEGFFNPLLSLPFPAVQLAKILGWLWLGSLPLSAFYLWTSERINSLAVPVMLGLTGILLTIALSGQELQHAWKRDLNPWALPYVCAQQLAPQHGMQQRAHVAAKFFQEEPNVLRLPNGKRVKTWQNIPDDVLFPPPPPTPPSVLAVFSVGASLLLFAFGYASSGHIRT